MINIWDMRWILTTHISAANISNPNLHIKVQHFRFIWGCMDSPRVDRWDFLMVCVKRKHSTINKKSSAPYRCFFFAWSIGVQKNWQIRCQAAGAAAVMTTSLPKRFAAAPSPSFLGMFFFLFMSSWMIRDEILLCVYRSSWKFRVIFGYPKKRWAWLWKGVNEWFNFFKTLYHT